MRAQRMTMAGMVIVLLLAGLAPAAAQDGGVGGLQTFIVSMPDGVELATDVYFPAGDGPWPVLLLRTPYNRRSMGGMADMVIAAGITVVMQDVRGRFDSGGEFLPFRNDKVDGQATLDWILAQEWSTDRIATWGASALGIASYMLAPDAPPELVCQWVEVATPDVYAHAAFQGGTYREALFELWLTGMGETDVIPILRDHPLNDDYWDVTQIVDDYDQVNVVGVHIGGWYDIFARGTVAAFQGYQDQGGTGAAGQQMLIMGPWAHATNNPTVGELTFPNGKFKKYEQTLLQWAQACLLDDTPEQALAAFTGQPNVHYFTMGAVGEADAPGNEWHTAETWPPEHIEIPVYLHPNNYLSIDTPPEDGGGDAFAYDPADPTPTICGQNLNIPAGPCDQREVEARDDVVVYSTMPLPEPVEVTGHVRVEVWITTDVVDTDIVVRLTDVYPDGRSMLVADGIARARYHASPNFDIETFLEPSVPVMLTVDLGPTSIVFNAGHRIRISVTSSNAPRFGPNPNTGAAILLEGETGQIAHTTILHDAEYPSALILPVR